MHVLLVDEDMDHLWPMHWEWNKSWEGCVPSHSKNSAGEDMNCSEPCFISMARESVGVCDVSSLWRVWCWAIRIMSITNICVHLLSMRLGDWPTQVSSRPALDVKTLSQLTRLDSNRTTYRHYTFIVAHRFQVVPLIYCNRVRIGAKTRQRYPWMYDYGTILM